jgi:hypothetical protein
MRPDRRGRRQDLHCRANPSAGPRPVTDSLTKYEDLLRSVGRGPQQPAMDFALLCFGIGRGHCEGDTRHRSCSCCRAFYPSAPPAPSRRNSGHVGYAGLLPAGVVAPGHYGPLGRPARAAVFRYRPQPDRPLAPRTTRVRATQSAPDRLPKLAGDAHLTLDPVDGADAQPDLPRHLADADAFGELAASFG